ncbi:MAG: CHASE2 domain-containing protein [Alphaproteobacteria bacterium]|nr:CHASE2 domain-containing protein [Alphaproteobacteria bacterium]
MVVAVVCFADLLAEQQNAINDVTFQLLRRPASGDIVIVQIDSKSLSALDTWPWPRRTHAELIDRLIESGAEIVALDIDFSSASVPADDARLAQSIQKAAGHIVLPSFVQTLSPGVTSQLVETNPLPVLRDNALIGNANVFAPYGAARQGSLGMYLADGRYRPTFAALVAQRERAFVTTFDIDFGIDRATIPRLSYIDVLRGAFDPALVKGKRVIVGATAVELGDRVPVPLHGVVAGVEVQALTAESIWQNRMLTSLGFPGAMALVTLLLLVLRPSTAAWSIKGVGWRFAACGMALCVVPIAVTAMFPVVIDTAVGFSALILCLAFVGGREFSARAQTVLRERSANSMRSAMINLIVEESSDGVIVSDGHGRIELCNQRAGLLLSTTRSALLGRSTNTYLPRFEDMAEALCGDPLQRQCELMFEIDGNPLLLEVGARRLGKKVIAMATPVDTKIDVYTLRDVTAKRKAEEAERRANEERLLAERARSNFIANMSHELRTPLNAIIGFSEMMSAQVLGPMGTPAYVEYADVVAKSGHHLLSVVNNVLELSRMDSDDETPDVEEFDFNACANICVSLLRATRDYKGQTITVHPTVGNPIICAVSRLTKHVLINLLSNAVKFSEKDGNISVTSWNEGTQFGFEVSDDGAGIDPAVMPHLTTLFYHSNQSFTRKHDGLGVGLYLVKRALERMHGTLVFDSAPGKGTRVRVLLPRTVSEDEAAAA